MSTILPNIDRRDCRPIPRRQADLIISSAEKTISCKLTGVQRGGSAGGYGFGGNYWASVLEHMVVPLALVSTFLPGKERKSLPQDLGFLGLGWIGTS